MNNEKLLKDIRKKAIEDQKKRRDPRFLDAMGFLVAKGFLRTNYPIRPQPNKRLQIEDVLWAGHNVEPRILEVLPAAVLRLRKHFNLDPVRYADLAKIVDQLRRCEKKGNAFFGIPYEKIKVWAEFPLLDKRVKTAATKKKVKTFRLDPVVCDHLKDLAKEINCSEAQILEKLVLSSIPKSIRD